MHNETTIICLKYEFRITTIHKFKIFYSNPVLTAIKLTLLDLHRPANYTICIYDSPVRELFIYHISNLHHIKRIFTDHYRKKKQEFEQLKVQMYMFYEVE